MGHPKTKFILRSEVGLVSGRGIFPAHTPKKINIEAENHALENDFHLLCGCLVRFQPLIFQCLKKTWVSGRKLTQNHHHQQLDLELSGSGHLLLKHQNRIAMHYQSSYQFFVWPSFLRLFAIYIDVSWFVSSIIEMLHDFWGICFSGLQVPLLAISNLLVISHIKQRDDEANQPMSQQVLSAKTHQLFTTSFKKWNHTEKTEIFNKSNPFSDWKHTHPKTKNATKSYYTEQRTNNVEKIWWIKFHNKRP